MKRWLQGIGLTLFGILLCVGKLNYLGACVGIIGLARFLGKEE